MKTKTKLKLREIKEAILANPGQFDMARYFSRTLILLDRNGFRIREAEPTGCGTAACIAGWAVHLDKGNARLVESKTFDDGFAVFTEAKSLLGISRTAAERLFFSDEWPAIFRRGYRSLVPERRAVAAAKRIEYFIRTGK